MIPRAIDEIPVITVAAAFAEGTTVIRDASTYGIIGIKVWVFKGEVMARNEIPVAAPEAPAGDTRKVRKPMPTKTAGEAGEAKPAAKRVPAKKPAAKAADAKPEAAAKPEGEAAPAKAPVKRVRKTAPKADAAGKDVRE